MLQIETDDDSEEEVAARALAAGATGAEVQDRETGGRSGRAVVKAYFTRREAGEEARAEVGGHLSEMADADWAEEWKRHHRPIEVSPRLWVTPSWLAGAAPSGAAEVVIDPQMAFGTGSHATTFLCLRAIDAFLTRHAGAFVLDVGTGSGVLAVAAAMLGAGRVVGTDNDPVALRTARKNAELNGVASRCRFSGDRPRRIAGAFDLVVANILANTLVELSEEIAGKVKGELHLCGLLRHQVDEVRAAYEARRLRFAGSDFRDEWALVRMEAMR